MSIDVYSILYTALSWLKLYCLYVKYILWGSIFYLRLSCISSLVVRNRCECWMRLDGTNLEERRRCLQYRYCDSHHLLFGTTIRDIWFICQAFR
jgi:hypothetical protein